MHSEFNFKSTVRTILVGPDKTEYFVHKPALARAEAGDFFNKVFTTGFKEQHTNCLELPEDDADAFGGFIEWLYRTCGPRPAPTNFPGRGPDRLLQLYILAHKYMIIKLQDAVISEMYNRMQTLGWRGLGLVSDTLEQFLADVPSSHMHTLLARCFIDCALNSGRVVSSDPTELDEVMDELPDDFLRLMAREMWDIKLRSTRIDFDEIRGPKSKYLLQTPVDELPSVHILRLGTWGHLNR